MLHFGKKQTQLSEELTKLYRRLCRMERRIDKRSKRLYKLQEEWNGYAITYLHLQHTSSFSPLYSEPQKISVE